MFNTIRSRRALLLATLALALTVTACGDDNDGEESSKPEMLAIEITERGKNKFRMTAPKSLKAGVVEISLKSPAGKGTAHAAQLVRVEGNHTIDEVVKGLAVLDDPTPDWLSSAGGVGQTEAGATGSATQQLAPGRYVILDTGSPEGEDRIYAETGTTAELEVTGDAGRDVELPEVGTKITARDYTFTTSGLKAGRNDIEFDNAGKERHHMVAFPYRKGADLAGVKKFLTQEGEGSGPPPVDFESIVSTATLEGGAEQVTAIELKRGKYALVCFVSDRKGGPPHVAKGMIVEAAVE